ncbi:MAG: hypothetical protein V3T88_02995 [Nitrosomonadaceae bacterium]
MVKQAARAGATAFILVTALHTSVVGAHGKASMEEDSCMRRVGESMVHLSTYQPQYEPTAQYCTEIPKGGETFVVVDLVDQALRDMPVGIRVVKGTSETEDETVMIVKPDFHPDGVIWERANLDQGRYTVFITGEGVPPVRYQYSLRVQMVNYAKIIRSSIGPAIALLLLTFIGYKVVKTKRVQSWLASLRS